MSIFSRAKLWPSLFLTLTSAVLPVLAQTAPTAEQLLRVEQERLRAEQERNQTRQLPSGIDLKAQRPRATKMGTHGPCTNISQISVEGANEIYVAEMEDMRARYANHCLSSADIENLLAELTAEYVSRGFVTTRAYLPAQDLKSGKLRVLVLEGRIERMEVKGDAIDRIDLDLAVPARIGDLLNIRDLEQGVDQINSVRGNKVKLDLVPGSEPGKTVVVFNNTASNPLFVEMTSDNQGAVSTGKTGVGATLKLGGSLGFNETLSMTLRRAVPHSPEKSSESVGLNFNIPVGYASYGLGVSESQFSIGSVVPNRATLLYLDGKSTTVNLTADRTVARDQSSVHKAMLVVSSMDSKNYADGSMIQVSSRHTSTMSLGLNNVWTLDQGSLFLQPMIVMGMNGQNNLPVGLNQQSNGAQSEFTKYTLDGNLSREFKAAGENMAWTSVLRAQYSRTSLFSAQQILIGGLPSVRGYVSSFLTGDSGYYWRNDIALLKAHQIDGVNVQGRYYVGYDLGRVSSHDPSAISGQLSGIVAGASFQGKNASIDFSTTRADRLPSGLARESAQFYVRMSLHN